MVSLETAIPASILSCPFPIPFPPSHIHPPPSLGPGVDLHGGRLRWLKSRIGIFAMAFWQEVVVEDTHAEPLRKSCGQICNLLLLGRPHFPWPPSWIRPGYKRWLSWQGPTPRALSRASRARGLGTPRRVILYGGEEKKVQGRQEYIAVVPRYFYFCLLDRRG